MRNPITLVIVHYGFGERCRDRIDVLDNDWTMQLRRARQQLGWARQDGARTNELYSAKMVRR